MNFPEANGRNPGRPEQNNTRSWKPLRLKENNVFTETHQSQKSPKGPLHNLPPNLSQRHHEEFRKLSFKKYLGQYEDPSVWNAPRLIVQIDSLMRVLNKNEKYLIEGKFQLKHDMIILDEPGSLLAHIDEETMERKEMVIF